MPSAARACAGCGAPDLPTAVLPFQVRTGDDIDLYCHDCHAAMRQDEEPQEAVIAALARANLAAALTPAQLRDALEALLEASCITDVLLRGSMTGFEPRQAAVLN